MTPWENPNVSPDEIELTDMTSTQDRQKEFLKQFLLRKKLKTKNLRKKPLRRNIMKKKFNRT